MNATLAFPVPFKSRFSGLIESSHVQDGVFAALILASRIPANLGMTGGLICLVLTGIYGALRVRQSRDLLSRCWLQLSFPIFALLSVTWAVYPMVTLRASVQMTLTAFAGLLLSQTPRPRAVLVGLFVAYAGYTVASLIVGHSRPEGIDGTLSLYGLGGEAKNYFADTSGTAVLLALTMLAACIERRAFALATLSATVIAACGLATVRAHSAGATSALLLASMLLSVLLLFRGCSSGSKLIFAAVLGGAMIICVIFFQPILALVQELSAKDSGLTGRGYLWYRGDFIIAERPWLGVGYFGFWTPENPDAIGLWRYFDVRQEGTAFSFHNSYIQTLVETGRIGLGVMVMCWIIGITALLRRFVLTPSLPTCFWLGYIALQLSKSPVEPIRPSALIAPTIMLFAGLGFGFFPVGRNRHQFGTASRRLSSSRSMASSDIPLLSDMSSEEIRLIAPAIRM